MVLVATGDRIREFRESRHPKLTQEMLAHKAGIKRSRLAQYESGRTEPPLTVLKKIADALDTNANSLIDTESKPRQAAVTSTRRLKAEPVGKLKMYGGISAGPGNTSTFDVEELDVPQQFARDDYGGLVIEGDSMMPFLHSSDTAIFRDWQVFKPNHIMAAELPGGEWVVKLAAYDGEKYVLRSLNDRYPDVQGDFRVAGYLVGFIRDDGPERLIRLNPYGLRPD